MFDIWHKIKEDGESAIPAEPSALSALEWCEIGEIYPNLVPESGVVSMLHDMVTSDIVFTVPECSPYEDKDRFVEMVKEALPQRPYFEDMWQECEAKRKALFMEFGGKVRYPNAEICDEEIPG